MNWDAVQALVSVQPSGAAAALGGARPLPGAASAPGATFGAMVAEGLTKVNEGLLATQADMQELAVGNVQNLHQVIMRMEESRLSFELLMHVRNRVLEAYQDLMKMQI